jgi:GPI ethanolamine phosphate transferase 1
VVLAYLGWATHGATAVLFPDRPPLRSTTISVMALTALGISWTFFAIQNSPWTFYVYVAFPCYFWREALVASSGPLFELYRSGKLQGTIKLFLRAVFVIAALQSMVVRVTAFLYTKRNELIPTNRSGTLTGVFGVSDSLLLDSYGQHGVGLNRS